MSEFIPNLYGQELAYQTKPADKDLDSLSKDKCKSELPMKTRLLQRIPDTENLSFFDFPVVTRVIQFQLELLAQLFEITRRNPVVQTRKIEVLAQSQSITLTAPQKSHTLCPHHSK